MKLLDALLARFGYVKLGGYGLMLAPSGRIISLNGRVIEDDDGTVVGWRDDGGDAAILALPSGHLGAEPPHPATTAPGTRARATTAELDDLDWQQAVARARAGQDPYPSRPPTAAPVPPALAAAISAHPLVAAPPALPRVPVAPPVPVLAAPAAAPPPPSNDAWAVGTGTTATGDALAAAPTTIDDGAPVASAAPPRPLPRASQRSAATVGLAAPASLVRPAATTPPPSGPPAPARPRSGTLPGAVAMPAVVPPPVARPTAGAPQLSGAALTRLQLARTLSPTPAGGLPRLSAHRPPAKSG